MLKTVMLKRTSMRNIAANVYLQQLSTINQWYVLWLYNIKKCKSAQYLLWNDVNTQKYIDNLNAKLLPIIKRFF